jgi:O-antigen ligase/tetratricopeptide (TPR) repeat protein
MNLHSESQFKFLVFLYLLIGFVPLFGSIDILAPQWVYLSILNVISILSIYHSSTIINLSFVKLISFYIFFFLFSCVSIFKSINLSESFIELPRIFIFITSLLLFYLISTKIYNFSDWALTIISFILFFEVSFFYGNLYYFYSYLNVLNFKGIAGNVNITAMSIMIKCCFILHSIINNKRYKAFNFFLLISSISAVLLINSRTSLLSIFLLFTFSFLFLFSQKSFRRKSFLFLSIPLSSFLFSSVISKAISGENSSLNLILIDASSTERILYYKEALFSFVQNPFFGIGSGNWKIISIGLHSKFINSYFIPYHVHNDFLQVLAETGLLGFLSFFSFFSFFFFLLIKFFKLSVSLKSLHFFLIIAFLLYLIDSMLNFPMSRPLMLVNLIFIIVLFFSTIKSNINQSLFFNKYFFIPILLFSIGCFFSTILVYDSFKNQNILLSDFRAQSFDSDVNLIDDISSVYPSITATGLPIDALKANYYLNNTDTILTLLSRASKANPYIMYPEYLKSKVYYQLNDIDSTIFYAKKAFNGLPLNEYHAVNYLQLLKIKKDTFEIQRVFDITNKLNSLSITFSYFDAMAALYDINDRFIPLLNNYKVLLGEERYKSFNLIFSYGISNIKLANDLSLTAENQFLSKNYLKSANLFLDISKLIPSDPSYLENAAQAYYYANYNNEAITILEKLISDKISKTGKPEYLYGLILYETSNTVLGCEYLSKSSVLGNIDAPNAIKSLCR